MSGSVGVPCRRVEKDFSPSLTFLQNTPSYFLLPINKLPIGLQQTRENEKNILQRSKDGRSGSLTATFMTNCVKDWAGLSSDISSRITLKVQKSFTTATSVIIKSSLPGSPNIEIERTSIITSIYLGLTITIILDKLITVSIAITWGI